MKNMIMVVENDFNSVGGFENMTMQSLISKLPTSAELGSYMDKITMSYRKCIAHSQSNLSSARDVQKSYSYICQERNRQIYFENCLWSNAFLFLFPRARCHISNRLKKEWRKRRGDL